MSAHVLVVGAGGAIGSHLVPHLGRLPGVSRVTLIDRDTYDTANLAGQDITRRDVGRPKAIAQAARLRRLGPSLRVTGRHAALESLPLGALRADVIVSCLDSRIARQWVNEAARRLGVPLVDAGVDAGQLLARVNVYPACDAACLECAWDEHDYAALEQPYPCGGVTPAPTNAPSALGAFAAALAALECRRLLAEGSVPESRQALFDLSHHRLLVTTFRRNPRCRLADHEPWRIEPLRARPRDLALRDALALVPGGRALAVAGARLTTRRTCVSCGYARDRLTLVRARFAGHDPCPRCGGWFVSVGTDVFEELPRELARGPVAARSLATLGVRSGDVLTIRSLGGCARYEIRGEPA